MSGNSGSDRYLKWRNDTWCKGKYFSEGEMLECGDAWYKCVLSHTADSDSCHPFINRWNGKKCWKRTLNCVGKASDVCRRIKQGKVNVSTTVENATEVVGSIAFQGAAFQNVPSVTLSSTLGYVTLTDSSAKGCNFKVHISAPPTGGALLANDTNITVDWLAVSPIASAQYSKVSTDGTPTVLIGSTRRVILTLKDAENIPFVSGGATVTFAASRNSLPISVPFTDVIDMQDGTYVTTFTSDMTGTVDVSATINDDVTTSFFSFLVIVASVTSCDVALSNTVIENATSTNLTVNVKGTNGLPMSGVTILPTASSVSGAALIKFGNVVDNLDGSYTILCTSFGNPSAASGTSNLGAKITSSYYSAPLVIPAQVTLLVVTPGGVNPNYCSFVAPSGVVAAQLLSTTNLLLSLYDSKKIPIPSAGTSANPITVYQTGAGGGITTIENGGNGTYTIKFVANVIGPVTIRVAVNGVSVKPVVNLTIAGPTTSYPQSKISVDKASAFVSRLIVLTATIRDTNGVLMPNMNVQFMDNNALIPDLPVDNGDGTYMLAYTGSSVGAHGIQAAVQRQKLQQGAVIIQFVKQAVPSPVPGCSIVTRDGNVMLTPSAPLSDGGADILYYQAVADSAPLVVIRSIDGTITFSGLARTKSYRFSIYAVNNVGKSITAYVTAPVVPVL
jgi:hypothetical protein